MAPFSPLPPSHIQSQLAHDLQPPKFPLLFGQIKTLSKQHDFSQVPTKPLNGTRKSRQSQDRLQSQSHIEIFFQGGRLSFGILLCLFIATLWLLAAFSAAQMTLSLPSPSELAYLESDGMGVGANEASLWGEVGMYELSGWRRIRTNENENDETQSMNPNDPLINVDSGKNRWRRNEAVLEKLKESKTSTPSSLKVPFSSPSPSLALPESSASVLPNEKPQPSTLAPYFTADKKARSTNTLPAQGDHHPESNMNKSPVSQISGSPSSSVTPGNSNTVNRIDMDDKAPAKPQMDTSDSQNKGIETDHRQTKKEMVDQVTAEAEKQDEGEKATLESRRHRHKQQEGEGVDGGI